MNFVNQSFDCNGIVKNGSHHGKNFQDYPEWQNAIIFRIILNISEAIPRQEQ